MLYGRESGGVKRYLVSKHEWLTRLGMRHTVLVPGKRTSWQKTDWPCVASLPLPSSGGYRLPLRLKKWANILHALGPDLIEVGDPYHVAWMAKQVAREMKVPVVAFYHSDLPALLRTHLGAKAEKMAMRYLLRLYGDVDLILAPSLVMTQKLLSLGLKQVRHQPLGVDTSVFHPGKKDPLWRQRLGLDKETRLLVYAGRFSKEKHIPELLEAMTLLGKPYHLLLVGSGKRFSLPANVTSMPYVAKGETLATVLASADALVHAGDRETFGLVIVEAMACGLPVAAVGQAGVPELVTPEVGILAPRARAQDLAEAAAALFAADRQKMGANARRRAEDCYAWDKVLSSLLSSYQELIGYPRRQAVGG